MIPYDGYCQRCLKRSMSHIMSMFDDSLICPQCKRDERRHPDYKKAEAADLEAYAGRMEEAGCHPQSVENVREMARRFRREAGEG